MNNERQALTLFELNNLVRTVIEQTLDRSYWVKAELSEIRESNGHCFMQLVQNDPFANTPVARASAKCWARTWQRLKPRFERVTQQRLHAGMDVMLLVTASFHEAYGFSWTVEDIDPLFTLGDMARRRLEIINKLREEGVIDLQKELPIPMFAQRIAVISSGTAAGYGDFCNQLKNNDYGLKFYIRLFPAIMQGEGVEGSIISALNDINEVADCFDVVVIIRGGGAVADMSGFDSLPLAENVANFPLPIITGIGHDRDECVIDVVSHTKVKTPTAAAALLIDNLQGTAQHVDGLARRVTTTVSQRMERERMRLDHIAEKIPMVFRLMSEQQTARLNALGQRLAVAARQTVTQDRMRLVMIWRDLASAAQRRVMKEQSRIGQLEIKLQGVDPQVVLNRGYSITLCRGHVVRDAAALHEGDVVTSRLAKGSINAIVTANEGQKTSEENSK